MRVVSVESRYCNIGTDKLRMQQSVIQVKAAMFSPYEINRVDWIKSTL